MHVAILGFGKVAESTHLPGFASAPEGRRFSVVAVAEPSAERRARAAELLPHARLYEDAAALFAAEKDIELADVAAPPFLHARLVRLALGANAHVLCEKPLSLDVDEIRSFGKEARRRDRVLYTVDNWRHAPLSLEAIRRVRVGMVGPIRFLGWSVRRKAADPGAATAGKSWREDPRLALGGVLVDHGWHAFTIVRALLGPGRRTVRARLVTESDHGDVEAHVRLEQGETRACVRLTWRASRRANRGRILGAAGWMRLEDDRIETSVRETVRFPEKLSQGSIHPEWFPPVLQALRDEIEGRVRRGTNLEEALSCAATIRAAYDSARDRGRPVEIDDA
ncbi:MAG: Gfo/Idh/MocA family protein [Planctomycetota bacterium]